MPEDAAQSRPYVEFGWAPSATPEEDQALLHEIAMLIMEKLTGREPWVQATVRDDGSHVPDQGWVEAQEEGDVD